MAALFKDINIHWDTRLCEVDGETGYFHTWEQYSQPVEGSLMVAWHTVALRFVGCCFFKWKIQ